MRDDLAGLGLRAEAYHAGLDPRERARVQEDFLAGRAPGRCRVASTTLAEIARDSGGVATVTAASGLRELATCGALRPLLPLPDPEDPDGRQGQEGGGPVEVVVHLPRGRPDLGPARRLRDGALARVRAVAGYAAARGCRRRRLLAHFGEEGAIRCGACDRCDGRGPRSPRPPTPRFSLRRGAGSFSA